MPTYVYACDTCGAQFEQFQSFKEEPLRICHFCAGAVRRVFQPVGIVFKGSGWYVTDSRKTSSATVGAEEGAKSDKPSTSESSSKSESSGKSESSNANTSVATSDTKSSSASKPATE
jgi:putative FmdB family regulatory protein